MYLQHNHNQNESSNIVYAKKKQHLIFLSHKMATTSDASSPPGGAALLAKKEEEYVITHHIRPPRLWTAEDRAAYDKEREDGVQARIAEERKRMGDAEFEKSNRERELRHQEAEGRSVYMLNRKVIGRNGYRFAFLRPDTSKPVSFSNAALDLNEEYVLSYLHGYRDTHGETEEAKPWYPVLKAEMVRLFGAEGIEQRAEEAYFKVMK